MGTRLDAQRPPRDGVPEAPASGRGPEPIRALTPTTILALQRTAGNQAVARAVTVELRKEPPPPPIPPASERATPENRHLAAEIDDVAQLPDAQIEQRRHAAASQVGRSDGDHEKAVQSLDALEYVAGMRRLGPRKLDWKNYEYVRHDAGKRRAFLRMSVEEGVRESGSFEAAIDGMRDRGGKELDGDLYLLESDAKKFAAEFRGQARINAERMLRGSLHAIAGVLGSYGLPPVSAAVAAERILKGSGTEEEARNVVKRAKDSADDNGGANAPGRARHRMDLAGTAEHLKKLQGNVKDLQKRTNLAALDFPMDGKGPHAKAHTDLKHELKVATAELATAWIESERAHPVLAAYRGTTKQLEKIDLGTLDTASVDDQMKQVLEHILPKMAQIAKANQMIKSGTISPLALPAVVGLTRANMFVPNGSIRSGVINDLARKASRDTEPTWMIIASIALAIVTLVPSGGASLAVATGIAGASLAAYTAVKEYEHYDEQKVLIDTDLDRARALSQEEPSLTGFAMALVSLGLEGLPLIHAFKVALDIKRLKAAGGEADKVKRLVDELNKLGKDEKNVDNLGKQALNEVEKTESVAAKTTKKQDVPTKDELTGVQDELDELFGDEVAIPKGKTPPRSNPATLEKVRKRFKSPAEVHERTATALKGLTHGFDPANPPPGWAELISVLKANPSAINQEIEALLPVVLAGLRDPEIYAEVMAEAWAMLRADRDMTAALIEMAKADGFGVRVLPHNMGLVKDEKFVKEVAGKKKHWVDNPLVNNPHGVSSHLIQDIVVNRAFKKANIKMTSVEFRAKLGQATGKLDPMKVRRTAFTPIVTGGKEIATSELLWRVTYDSMIMGHLNRPESLGEILKKLLDVL
jgi:hypothetical protein